MKKNKPLVSILRSDTLFILVLTITLLVIAAFPLYNKIRITPPGYVYTLDQFKIIDFYIYTAVMRQGHTQWLMEDPGVITDEKVPGNLVNWYYILLGKGAHILGFPDGWMYYFAHAANLLALVASVVVLVRLILPVHLRRGALLLIFFGGVFPYVQKIGVKGLAIAQLWPWTLQWESAYHRIMHVPAHGLVEVLFVLSVILLILTIQKNKLRYALIAGICMFFGGIFFPPLALSLLTSVALTTIIYGLGAFFLGYKQLDRRQYMGIVFFTILTITGLVIIRQSIASGNPSYQGHIEGKSLSLQAQFSASVGKANEYLRLFWLFLPFIFLSFSPMLQGWKWKKLFIIFLWMSPFLAIFLYPAIGLESWRAANSMPFVAASILTLVGIDNFIGLLFLKKIFRRPLLIRWGILLILLLISFPQNYHYYQEELEPNFTTDVYLPMASIEAMNLLGSVAPKRSVVLSLEHVAMMLPSFTDTRGYGMKDYNDRWFLRGGALDGEILAFYSNRMTEKEAGAFLKRNHIHYVYFGWDEDDWAKELVYPKLLRPLFHKDGITLFAVAT